MKITVGSKNPVKIAAVKDFFSEKFDCLVEGVSADSEVSDQPKDLEETIFGAKNRAKNAFSEGLSVGIESGVIPAPGTNSGYFNLCVCAIFDGKNFFFGTTPGFEYEQRIIDAVHEGLEVSDAFSHAGYDKGRLGDGQGAIGLYTKGEMPRKEYTELALMMAWIHYK